MKKITLVLATASLAVSGAAIAGPSYTYVDLGYVVADSVGDDDSTGFAIRGSFGFADIFHVGGGVVDAESDGGKGSQSDGDDVSGYNLYFGINPAVTEAVDLVARLGYQATEFKFTDGKDEDTGLFIELGPRAMIGEKLELNAFAIWSVGETETTQAMATMKEDFSLWSYRVGGEYYFTPAISAGVDLVVDDFGDSANIHARWSFGNN